MRFVGCLKGLTLWFVAGQWGLECNVVLWSKREERSKTNLEKLGDGLACDVFSNYFGAMFYLF